MCHNMSTIRIVTVTACTGGHFETRVQASNNITPELTIGAPVYGDDILGIGNCKTVEKVIETPED